MAPKGSNTLAYLIAGVLLVSAGCAMLVMQSLHSGGGAGHVPSHKLTAPPAIGGERESHELAIPAQYQSNAELVAEYKALGADLATLKAHLRRMRIRHHDEAEPPRLGGLPPDRARGFGGAIPRPSAAVLDPVNKQPIAGGDSAVAPVVASPDDDTIFASVASFRDSECAGTVRDMFAKSKNQKRLYLGIIEQNEPEDKDKGCIPAEYTTAHCAADAFCPLDNIRMRRVRAAHAKGPTFGRYVAMLMYRGEKYFMMIDSHNRFAQNWDARFIAMYKQAPSKKAVLTHYPAAYTGPGQNLENAPHTTVMCNAHFIGTGFLRMDGMVMERSAIPRLQPFSAAGFLFADAKLLQEVPFDPYLDYLFDGEEILYSVRMWTHGWDMYSPSENLLFHFYIRSDAPRVWSIPNNKWWEHQQVSNARVQLFLGVTENNSTELMITPEKVDRKVQPVFTEDDKRRLFAELSKYGLGAERSLEAYYKFANVDPVRRQGGKGFCDKARTLGKA
jgi:hypothetical protein